MGYKVGDKVKIREDLEEGFQYHETEVVSEYMVQYAGETATVKTDFGDDTYGLDCDEGEWYWPEKTLIPVNQNRADKIRSMSDEELAEFLSKFSACECCKYKDEERDTCGAPVGFICVKEYAEAIIVDWLQKSSKEEIE